MSVAMISSGEIQTVLAFVYYNRVAIISHPMRHASLHRIGRQIVDDNRAEFDALYCGRHVYKAARPSARDPEFCASVRDARIASQHIQYNTATGSPANELCQCVVAYCDALEGL